VLDEEVAVRARQRGLSPWVLQAHPTIATVPPLPGTTQPADRVTVSLLGELRGGKGLDLVLDALLLLGPRLRQSLHVRFGGRAYDSTLARVEAVVAAAQVTAEIRLHGGADFDVLTPIEFADLCYGTDIGLLLYQEHQRDVMSGVLPNFVAVGAAIIGTSDSVVGSIINRNRLGVTIDDETPIALHDAIATLADAAVRGQLVNSPQYAAYREAGSPAAVHRSLRRILDLDGKSES
jgi:hypothetical protein